MSGKAMEMRVNGQVIVSVAIREPIVGGSMQISGSFSPEEAREIAGRLPGSKLEIELVPK